MTNRKILFYTGFILFAGVSVIGAIVGLGTSSDPGVQAGEFKMQEFTCVSFVDSRKAEGERSKCIVEVLDQSTAWLAEHITDVELETTRYTVGITYRDVEP